MMIRPSRDFQQQRRFTWLEYLLFSARLKSSCLPRRLKQLMHPRFKLPIKHLIKFPDELSNVQMLREASDVT